MPRHLPSTTLSTFVLLSGSCQSRGDCVAQAVPLDGSAQERNGAQYSAHMRKGSTSSVACEVRCWRWLFGNEIPVSTAGRLPRPLRVSDPELGHEPWDLTCLSHFRRLKTPAIAVGFQRAVLRLLGVSASLTNLGPLP